MVPWYPSELEEINQGSCLENPLVGFASSLEGFRTDLRDPPLSFPHLAASNLSSKLTVLFLTGDS